MKKIFIILSIFYTAQLFSQATFQKAYMTNHKFSFTVDIKRTSDNGYLHLEMFLDSLALLKTDSVGTISWTKRISNGNSLNARVLEQTSDGGYIILGEGEIPNIGMHVFLIKTDKGGTISWTKQFIDTVTVLHVFAKSIKQTTDHGFIISSSGTDKKTYKPFVSMMRTDSLGNILWAKKYNSFIAYPFYEVNITSPCAWQTNDNGFILSCADNSQQMLLKTDSIGEIKWAKRLIYSNSKESYYTQCPSIEKTPEGGYIMAGTWSESGNPIKSVLLIKINAIGVIIWAKIWGSLGYGNINCMKQTNDFGYLIAGSTDNKAYLAKTDSSGDMKWSKTFINGGAYSILQNPDKGYVIGGATGIKGNDRSFSSFMKLDSLGNGGICYDSVPPITQSSIPLNFIAVTPLSYSWPLITTKSTYSVTNEVSTVMPCAAVGIFEETQISEILVYPNPSLGQFTFSKLPPESKIEVFDLLGNVIFQSAAISDNYTVDIGQRSKGLYIYKIINNNRIIQSGKISLE